MPKKAPAGRRFLVSTVHRLVVAVSVMTLLEVLNTFCGALHKLFTALFANDVVLFKTFGDMCVAGHVLAVVAPQIVAATWGKVGAALLYTTAGFRRHHTPR